MASRILTKENADDGTGGNRCRKMCGFWDSAIRYYSKIFQYREDIEPIIAKNNRFDGVKAKY